MSLILEALRKSEAERRLGQAPGVLTAMPVLRAPTRHPRWPLPGAVLLAAAVIVAAVSWWLHSASSPPTHNDAPGAIPAHRARATQPASSAASRASALPVITLPTTTAPPARGASVEAGPSDATASGSASHGARTIATPGSPGTSATGDLPPTIAIDVKPAVAERATPASKPTVADEPALPLLSELSADERSGLPALKVSMHVYADDPAQRFMIIDGQRLGEGARIAEGVTLVRIRRDGAELDLQGRRLLLPNP